MSQESIQWVIKLIQLDRRTEVFFFKESSKSLFLPLNKTIKCIFSSRNYDLFFLQLWDYISQLTLCKDPPPLITVTMSDKPCRSHTTHHVLTQWKIHCGAKGKLTTRWQERQRVTFGRKQGLRFQIVISLRHSNTVLWLFNLLWQMTAYSLGSSDIITKCILIFT